MMKRFTFAGKNDGAGFHPREQFFYPALRLAKLCAELRNRIEICPISKPPKYFAMKEYFARLSFPGASGLVTPKTEEPSDDPEQTNCSSHLPDLGHAHRLGVAIRCRAMRQRARRFRGLEATVRRASASQRGWRIRRFSLDGDELCVCDHRRRSRPAKFQSVARSVPCQAGRIEHRRARARNEAITRCAVCIT